MATTKPIAEMGVIRDGESYSLEIFKRQTRLSAWEFQEAKCAGLKVRYVGKQGYVLGSDWLAFLHAQGRGHAWTYQWHFVTGLIAKLLALWLTTKHFAP